MSTYTRRRPLQNNAKFSRAMIHKADEELTKGYLEVEITGLTWNRLIAAYTVLLRGVWSHLLGGVRSRPRPTPVH